MKLDFLPIFYCHVWKYVGQSNSFIHKFVSSLYLKVRKMLSIWFSLLITSNQSGHSSLYHGSKIFPLTGHSLAFRSFFVNLIWLSVKIPVDLFLESSEQPHLPPTVKPCSWSLHLKLLSHSNAQNLASITLNIQCNPTQSKDFVSFLVQKTKILFKTETEPHRNMSHTLWVCQRYGC